MVIYFFFVAQIQHIYKGIIKIGLFFVFIIIVLFFILFINKKFYIDNLFLSLGILLI